jgi:hypothetical protein
MDGYGMDIDEHCRTKCPQSRRDRCHHRASRVVRQGRGEVTSIFFDAKAPADCDHPEILEINGLVEEAVRKCAEANERLLRRRKTCSSE